MNEDWTDDQIADAAIAAGFVDEEPERPRRRLVLTAASDIEPEPVVWAWRHEDDLTDGSGRIPLGSLSVAAGREGTGKSSFGIWLAAMITRGTLPGSLYGQPRAVIYAAVEDSWKYTLVPRLIAAGADLTKVFRVEVVEDEQDGTTLSLPVDNSLLEREMRRVGAALLVLDPLMSTIGAGIDTHRERDVRVALDPLARLADRARCVVLGIAHFNKGAGTDPSSLITGSGAFKNVPRSVFGFAADPEGGRVMTQTKNSLGRLDLPSLSYEIEGVEIPTRLGPAHVGRLVWLGESDRSVTDILSDRGDPEDQEDRKDAADWLRGYLVDQGGEASAVDVFKAGEKDGFRKDALKRAKRKAGVLSEKSGMDAGWMWRLKPAEGSEGSKGADGIEPAPFVLPSEHDPAKGAPKGAPPRELRPSLPSLPSLPSEPDSPHSWWVASNRPEHPNCLACRAMRPGGAA
ncbi:AAA family ATPase [Micromonospora sp. NPDC005413]|uniref:AAA family ATPase n=1 Tax=Micromonospora sp. NPDC005413 TaxID=3154563 RepID=UPI0033A62E97